MSGLLLYAKHSREIGAARANVKRLIFQTETLPLQDALSACSRVHARCIDGQVDYTCSSAKCRYRAELDLETLVWTRGRNMSLAGKAALNAMRLCQ
jgi:hypothetical protein